MINRNNAFSGIIPALITPFREDGAINRRVARQLVDHLLCQGVSGFYINGSTGEGFLQTVEERKQFLEIVLEAVGNRVPVITHVGAMDTATCLDLTRHAARTGAAAVSAVAPFYYKHGQEQIRQHYLDIANETDIPLIIYHFPAFTGTHSSTEFYRDIAAMKGIIGVKFTSVDVFELQQLIDACGKQFHVFNGPDEILVAGLVMGCCGAIGSTYNIMAGKFVELYRHFRNGNMERARDIQYEVNRVIAGLSRYNFIAFEREILRLQGFDVGKPRKPIQQLTAEQSDNIRQVAATFPFLETVK